MTAPAGANPIRAALAALDAAGVRWCLRNAPERVDELPPGSDIDVIVGASDLPPARDAIGGAGFAAFDAPGHRGHHFFLALLPDGRWAKLDVMIDGGLVDRRQRLGDLWVAGDADLAAHAASRAAGRPAATLRQRVGRARLHRLRRSGPVVAFVGPDGAGKGSIIDALVALIPVGVTVIRLGTARSGPTPDPDAAVPEAAPRHPFAPREVAFVVRKWIRSIRRLAVAYFAAWRGHIVLCDRHPVEVVAVDPQRGTLARAVERFLLTRALPHPDVLVVLDAPADVLVARKPEHPRAVIEAWQQRFRTLPGAVIVDTAQPIGASTAQVSEIVFGALARRRAW